MEDAHDGTPVVGARVAVLIPAFGGEGVATSTYSDETGTFRLEHVADLPPEGARLEAAARWHATLERPLPPAGHVAIGLVTRRRALLERLVRWAVKKGRPFMDRGEPTPGAVARAAHQQRRSEVESWARAVERAAYGREPVDETEERKVKEREPGRNVPRDAIR